MQHYLSIPWATFEETGTGEFEWTEKFEELNLCISILLIKSFHFPWNILQPLYDSSAFLYVMVLLAGKTVVGTLLIQASKMVLKMEW